MAVEVSSVDAFMGSSVADLDTLALDVTLSDDVVRSWQLAQDAYIEAIQKDTDGDHEAAYMLYKRYVYIVQKTQTSRIYLLDKSHWDPYFNPEELLSALERCDKLAEHLTNRYKDEGMVASLRSSLQELSGTKVTESAAVERTIIVTDLPSDVTEDSVMLYFERRRISYGGPVEKVELRADGSAMVYFEDSESASRVLKKTSHQIKNKDVHVSAYVPEKTIGENTIKVTGVNNLSEDVLEMYFENTRKSGGGKIHCIKRNEQTGVVQITFCSSKGAERVLRKEHHTIKNTILQVSAFTEETQSAETTCDVTCTVEVRDFGTLSEDVIEMYFEDTRKSGGSDVTELTKQDEVIYIRFENDKAATRVLNRQHTIKGQELSVRPLLSSVTYLSEEVEASTVKVQGCMELTDDLLLMYFQNKKRSGGGDIRFFKRNGDIAFVGFDSADAQRVLERSHILGTCELTVSLDTQSEMSSSERINELESDSSSSDEANEENEMFVLQVHALKQVSVDTLTLYFENRRRSGGGEVEGVEVDTNQDYALVYFKEGGAVGRIIQKSPHLLEGRTLLIEPYIRSKPQGIMSWLRCLRKANTIEVKGCMEVGNEKLKFYFDNEIRSGGSDVKEVKISEENKDVAYIVFKDTKVAERVSKREHVIGISQLAVKLVKPGPKYDNRFLVTGLHELTTRNKLSEYLKKYTSCKPLRIECGQDNRIILITADISTKPLGIKDIQKKCSQIPLDGAFLDVSPMPISNCILVKGLDESTDNDHICLYFETKGSGNNMQVRVEKVERNFADEALVYFENYKVIEQILHRKHRLGSANVVVTLYMECLQPGHSVFQLPPAFSIDNVERYLVKYIQESADQEAALTSQLRSTYAELRWTSDESAEIKCLLSEEVPEVRKLVTSWERNVRKTCQRFIDQFQIETIKVLDGIWDNVKPKLEMIDRDHCKVYILPGCQFVAVGPHRFVRDLLEKIHDYIIAAENESQERNTEITETISNFDTLVLKLLQHVNFCKEITADHTGVTVHFSEDANQIILTGPLEEVRQAKQQIVKTAKTVVVLDIGNMSDAQMDLVAKQDVQDYLFSKMIKKGLVGKWIADKGKLKVASFSDVDVHATVHMIKQSIFEQKICLKKESLALVQSKKWSEFVDFLVKDKGNFVKVFSDIQKRIVTIYALDKENVTVTEDVNNFISDNTVYTDFLKYPPGVQRFLCEQEKDYIRSFSIMYQRYSVEILESIAKVRFNFRGTKEGLNLVRHELDKLSKQIIHRKHEFSKPGIAKLLLSDKGSNVIRNVEKAERCVIEYDFNSEEATQHGHEDDSDTPEEKFTCTIAPGRNLVICQGDITELKVDAIVNAANNRLAHTGGLAKMILEKGGPTIKEESETIMKATVELLIGDAVVTKAGSLPCKWVIHAVGPTWSGGHQNEEELLREAVFKAIEEADNKQMTSVAFPALSTGIFNYPKEAATRVIIDAIKESFHQSPDSKIENIYACDKNPETVNAFIKAADSKRDKENRRSIGEVLKPPAGGILMPAVAELSVGLTSFTVGKVRFMVKKGDITKENVDCIVIYTDLSMKKGAVSKAILKAGGRDLASEIETKSEEMTKKGVVTTTAGNLPSAHIVHVSVDFFNVDWKRIIRKSLKATKNHRNIKCIAFPAMGTGNYETSPEQMAKMFVEALDECKGKHHLHEVRVVIYDEEVHDVFMRGVLKAVTKSKGHKSIFHRAKGLVMGRPTVTLHFFSDNTTHIEQAIARLEDHYMDNRLEKTVMDDALKNMNKQQVEEIKKLKEAHSVQVEYTPRLGRVRLQGLMTDVLPAIDAVHKIIHDVHHYIQTALQAKMLSDYLQWTYIEKDSTITEYDYLLNKTIEDAFNSGQKTVQVTPAGGNLVEIDFELMVQYPVKKPAETLAIVRKNLIKGASYDPPPTWVHMSCDSEMVKVSTDSKEYQDVAQTFLGSVGEKRNIIQIQRIQTKFLWQQYVAKKEQLAIQNPGHENQNFLWHGTTAEAFKSIARAGFNRSYCGKNSTSRGEGVYFSTSASYAVQNAYSKPDKDGHKHVFLARVLTGEFTKGKQGLRVPPTRDETKHVLYDSVVDDLNNPAMFVIFNDTQAYPDYLISFV